MKSLSPKLSSRIAEVPYFIFNKKLNAVSGYIKKFFDFNSNNVCQGTTGGFLSLGGMTSDFVAIGQGKREFKDTIVISFRGTQKNVGDILADANIGLSGRC